MTEDTTSRVGQQIGNYRIVKLLGQGSFADVYLGEHTLLKTQVAVKIMRVHLTQNLLEEFLNEAQTVARLRHPHIVRVFEGNVQDGTPYLVMDYHNGGTLRGLYPPGTQLPPTQVALFVEQVASALYYAHQQRLIHRDVKPENILVDADGQLLLSDFGLVLIAQSSRSQTVNVIAGTAPYMAPEQLQGRLRFASDQYSLGIIAYEWLTGERPFNGSFVEIASQHMLVPPPSLQQKVPTLPDAVEQVVLKALAKEPTQRFANTVEFAQALTQACMDLSYLPTAMLKPPDPSLPQPSTHQAQSLDVMPPVSQTNQSAAPALSGSTVRSDEPQFSLPPMQRAQPISTAAPTSQTNLVTSAATSDKTMLSDPATMVSPHAPMRPPDPNPVVASQTSSAFSGGWKRPSRSFMLFAILAILVLVIGVASGVFWFLARTGPRTTATPSPTPIVLVAKGQVSFLDSQNNAPGASDALKIAATGLPNPPDGSAYYAWLIDTANEKILPLGSLSKSDPTTFALSYANTGSEARTNLIGAGNKIDVTQEQGNVTAPGEKVVLSATFPPQAFVHIRHILFKFPTTPGNTGLLTGLVNETQKVNALSQLLQHNTDNTFSVNCIAQAMVNVIEGKNGAHFKPLAVGCASVGVGNTVAGDGFGILGEGYITVATAHATLAASQSDSTDIIKQRAKDVAASTDSVKAVITKINEEALKVLADPATAPNEVAELVSLSDRAYRGFDQNGDGKIAPIGGEAGALIAYTSGQLMATLSLVK
jgi:serine/threonine protein kinase